MINIMICDDMEEMRYYFEWIVNSQSDMEVIAMAESGKEAVEKANLVIPDVILMDVQMEERKDGINATESIIKMHPNIKIIMLTIHDEDDLLIESYVAGAVDYIIKETNATDICNTIRLAYTNKFFVGSVIAQKVKEKFSRETVFMTSALFFVNNMSKLTNSEWKVLRYIYNGKKRKEIAKIEVLSEQTVKFHTRNILKKLNFETTSEMVSYLNKLHIMEEFHL